MSFDGLPPYLQISSSKSYYLSKILKLGFRKQFGFYRKVLAMLKSCSDVLKLWHDFLIKIKSWSDGPSNRSPKRHHRATIFYEPKALQTCSRSCSDFCKSWHDFFFTWKQKKLLFVASNSCKNI